MSDVNIITGNKVISLPKEKFCNGKQMRGSLIDFQENDIKQMFFGHHLSFLTYFSNYFFVAKAKRQLQKSPTSIGGEMIAD
ncbi:hypothetical protein [Lysinibacillus sp. NPDC059133]|uniref:hypothetical protein n=1 Tax=Lysinibacillus sp. NPDC059133 TaxID=3346737 RepID=UPI00368DE332